MRVRLPFRAVRHRLNRLSQVGSREHLLLAEATMHLLSARIALAAVPFARLARRMGGFIPPHEARATASLATPSPVHQALAEEIGWAVTRAAQHLPFDAVCLPQAMAARAMLRRRGIACIMHFGTARGESVGLAAHAWVDAGPVEVTGYPVEDGFTEIACLAG